MDHRDQVAPRRLGVGHDQPEHRAADDLVERVPEETQPEVVQEDDAALGIPAEHDAVRAVDDRAVARLGGAQLRDLAPEPPDLRAERIDLSRGQHGVPLSPRLPSPIQGTRMRLR